MENKTSLLTLFSFCFFHMKVYVSIGKFKKQQQGKEKKREWFSSLIFQRKIQNYSQKISDTSYARSNVCTPKCLLVDDLNVNLMKEKPNDYNHSKFFHVSCLLLFPYIVCLIQKQKKAHFICLLFCLYIDTHTHTTEDYD